MYIVTAELGYGYSQYANIDDGNYLSKVDSLYIDLDGDTIVDGWYYWDASGYQNGQFKYQNTSQNYPVNTMSDSIYI